MATAEVVQSNNSVSIYDPWPGYWPPVQTYIYPTYTFPFPVEEYANHVEVERGEHDVTLHFYRSSGPGKGKTLVKTVVVPLSLFELLTSA